MQISMEHFAFDECRFRPADGQETILCAGHSWLVSRQKRSVVAVRRASRAAEPATGSLVVLLLNSARASVWFHQAQATVTYRQKGRSERRLAIKRDRDLSAPFSRAMRRFWSARINVAVFDPLKTIAAATIANAVNVVARYSAAFEDTILTDNKCRPGEWCGGQLVFSKPIVADGLMEIAVSVCLGGETHLIEVGYPA